MRFLEYCAMKHNATKTHAKLLLSLMLSAKQGKNETQLYQGGGRNGEALVQILRANAQSDLLFDRGNFTAQYYRLTITKCKSWP